MSTPVFVLSNICLIKSVPHQRCSWGLDLFGLIWSLFFFHQFIIRRLSFYASALHSYMRRSLMVRIAFLSQQWEFKYFDFRVPFIFCSSFIDPTAWLHSSPSLKNYAGSCRGEDVIFLSARDDGCIVHTYRRKMSSQLAAAVYPMTIIPNSAYEKGAETFFRKSDEVLGPLNRRNGNSSKHSDDNVMQISNPNVGCSFFHNSGVLVLVGHFGQRLIEMGAYARPDVSDSEVPNEKETKEYWCGWDSGSKCWDWIEWLNRTHVDVH